MILRAPPRTRRSRLLKAVELHSAGGVTRRTQVPRRSSTWPIVSFSVIWLSRTLDCIMYLYKYAIRLFVPGNDRPKAKGYERPRFGRSTGDGWYAVGMKRVISASAIHSW